MYPYHLVLVINTLDFGGAAKMVSYVANQAAKAYEKVTLVSMASLTPHYELDPRIHVEMLGADFSKPAGVKEYLHRLRKMKSCFVSLHADAYFAFNTPVVVFTKLSAPKGAVVAGSDRGNPEALEKKYRISAKYLYPKCDLLSFQSKEAQDFFGDKVNEISSVIPNPFRPNGQDPGVYDGPRDKRIVSVSRLSGEKNIDILIQAFAGCEAANDHQLVIYGDGPSKQSLQALARDLGVGDRVLFPGSTNQVMMEIQKASCFVLPSRCEGMPNGQIEAMSLGVPCIATNCMAGGKNHLITDHYDGIVVSVGSIEEMRAALGELLSDPETARVMGQRAAEIRDKLDPERIDRLWQEFFMAINQKIENKTKK